MEDIRRPQQPQRRDYAMPARPPQAAAPHRPAYQPDIAPATPGYSPAPPVRPGNPYSEPAPRPAYQPLPGPAAYTPQSAGNQAYAAISDHPQPPAIGRPANHRWLSLRGRSKKPMVLAVAIAISAATFLAGYMFRSSAAEDRLPAKITAQASYDLYFPAPMPAGFKFMKDTATFQIGQVFYKFANGKKRVTVKEEPVGGQKPNLNLLEGYGQFDSPVGRAALGSTFGQPTAVVVAGSTVITMNTAGGVSPQELKSAINSLKNIGHK